MSSKLQPGQQVKVLRGSFRNFVGTVAEVKPQTGKVRVTLSLFNNPVTFELGVGQVKQV